MASTVDDTQAAAASWVGAADAVVGVALDVARVAAGEEGAGEVGEGEVPEPAGSPEHPASASASRAVVVAARRRVVRGRDVADST
jgi:hypothetical protein